MCGASDIAPHIGFIQVTAITAHYPLSVRMSPMWRRWPESGCLAKLNKEFQEKISIFAFINLIFYLYPEYGDT